MKKKILALFLTVCMAASALVFPASAAGTSRFSDISDQSTATAVETLRLMGVLGGYSDGTFRPAGQLTRAQFCKMVTYAMNSEGELGMHRTVTVFPDVKPSHWAASYINLAAKGKGIIGGYPNGLFQPERTVTVGHAVTILLRLLGYKDENIGGVWPDSYIAVGTTAGLTDGVGTNGSAPLTRAKAARLFMNLLRAKGPDGGTLYTLGAETVLASVDGGSGIMKTSDGKTYTMVNPVASTALVGASGQVVLNEDGKALTFLPEEGSGGNTTSAIIVYEDRSSAGFAELAGGSGYTLYKNGVPATLADVRKNDVATFNTATNAIQLSDTRVSVYYESCEPSPSAPAKITVLGGTEFDVLPTAMDSLADFKPGKQMTLLLTAEGKVAAAVESSAGARSNAMGLVDETGGIKLLCGTTWVTLNAEADAQYYGQAVRVSASKRDSVNLSALSGGVSGDLDVVSRMLGSKELADHVMIFDGSEQIGLSQIASGVIAEEDIAYARTNWAGQVDLIVLGSGQGGTVYYGKASVREEEIPSELGSYVVRYLSVEYAKDGQKVTSQEAQTGYAVESGDYVEAVLRDGRYRSVSVLTQLKDVSSNAWTGKTAVTFGGRTYMVPSDVVCYNKDSRAWTTLEKALAYADELDLYVKGNTVRVIEVGS